MRKEVKRNNLIHVQFSKDERCIDMLLTQSEIEKGVARALDQKNFNLLAEKCCTCWPIEKPPKCGFWDRLLFNCSK